MNFQMKMRSIVAVLVVFSAFLMGAGAANAAGPAVKVASVSPEFITAGKGFVFIVNIHNVSSDTLTDVELTYTLPTGISLTDPDDVLIYGYDGHCDVAGQEVKCVFGPLESGIQTRIIPYATVDPSANGKLEGSLEVSAGGEVVSKSLTFTVGPSGPFAIRSFEVEIEDASMFPSTQAGATPTEIAASASVRSRAFSAFDLGIPNASTIAPTENFRNVVTHIPPGFVGYPDANPVLCTQAQLARAYEPPGFSTSIGVADCPIGSQVGIARVYTGDIEAVYNLVPPAGSPAALGFIYNGVVVTLLAQVRPSDYGIDFVAKDVANSVPLAYTNVTLWGVPADPSHNRLRHSCLLGWSGYNPTFPCPFSGTRAPFLRNPTSCTGSRPAWSIEMDTYQNPGNFVSASTTTDPIEGCEKLPFEPALALSPSDRSARSPSGLAVEVAMPQDNGPDGLGQADLRSASVVLPEGVTINPASADGLAACGDAELRLGLAGPSECPDAAKLGSLELTTPLLDKPIGGSVYLRSQASQDPESGDLFRLALEIRSDQLGIAIRLPGSLVVDEETGRLTTRFSDLPQLPFESMQLHLKGGPRAPLTMPRDCGTYAAHAEFTGWNDKTLGVESKFAIDQNCTPPPFKPGFEAGVTNSTAGEFAPFVLRVTRDTSQPNISRIDATLPEGEEAKLAGVPVCGNAQAQSGDCPAGSRIGSVVAGIGEGASPLFLPQAGKSPTAVYFAGPYKGAPYSIVAEVPAQAGPFDLGQVFVRSALQVDPTTAQVTVASDPLPQMFSGIPVSYRDVRVKIDRPEYTLNPTDCEPTAVTAAITSSEGGTVQVSDRFQVADCAALGFKPKLSLRLAGKASRSGHPALTAVLKMPSGGANIAKTVVTLPGSEFIAQDHLDTVCTRVQYAADGGGGAGCPKGSAYGHAWAFTPLLDYPLAGPVYLRSNGGERELPDLVASLGGGIHVDLVGYIDSDKRTGGLRTTFAKVPDAPVSRFVLKMPGGDKSLLENSTNICRGKHRASVKMAGQNGKVHDFRPLVRAKCGKGARGR